MKSWGQALRDAWWSGTWASVASAAAIALARRSATRSSPVRSDAAGRKSRGVVAQRGQPGLRDSVAGYAIHHLSAVSCAVLYERWFGDRADAGDLPAALGGGLAIAALVQVIDQRLMPTRPEPGLDPRLSSATVVGFGAVFALGLAVSSLARPTRRQASAVKLPWRAHARRVRARGPAGTLRYTGNRIIRRRAVP